MEFDPQQMDDMPLAQQQNLCKDEIKTGIIKCLQTLAKPTPSQQQLDQANVSTVQLLKNHGSLMVLVDLIADQNVQVLVKKGACTMVDNYIRLQTNHITDLNRKHDKMKIHETLYHFFISNKVEDTYKLILEKPYIKLIHHEQAKCTHLRQDLVSKIGQFFSNKENMQKPYLLRSICYLIRVLVHCTIEKSLMSDLVVNIMDTLLDWLFQKVNIIDEALITLNQAVFTKQIELFSLCLQVFKLTFIKTDPQRFQVTKYQYISRHIVSQLILKVFKLKMPKLPDQQVKLIIQTKGIKALESVNQSRRCCLQILNNCLRCLDRTQKVKVSKDKMAEWWERSQFSHIIVTCKLLMNIFPQYLARQLTEYPTTKLIDSQLTNCIIVFMSIAVKLPPIYEIAAKFRDLCLFSICLQCLLSSPEAKSKSAQDYIAYRQDIANSQTFPLIQNHAARLLQSYADYIDGALSKIITVMINFIEFQLTANTNFAKDIPETLFDSNFFTSQHNTLEDHLQTAFCVLSIISYKAQIRQDIPLLLSQMLERRRDYFFSLKLNVRVACSMLLCYTYYADNIYNLVQKNKVNKQFHQAFINHVIILNKVYGNGLMAPQLQIHKQIVKDVDPQLKKIIVIQTYDCLQNCINQKQFFSSLFSEQKEQELFVQMYDSLIDDLNSPFNTKLTSIVEDLFKQKMRVHYTGKRNDLPLIVSRDLVMHTAHKIVSFYPRITYNKSLIQNNILNIMELLYLAALNPLDLYPFTKDIFNNLYKMQVNSDIQQIMDCIYHLLRYITQNPENQAQRAQNQVKFQQEQNNQRQKEERVQNSSESVQKIVKYQTNRIQVANQICVIVLNGLQSILNEGQFGITFGIIQELISLKIKTQDILLKISQLIFKYTDQTLRQQCAFLLMQLVSQNYRLVSKETLQKLMTSILVQLQGDYIRQERGVYGKLLIILLTSLQQDLQLWKTKYAQPVIANMFKLLLSNHKIYHSKVQRKLFILKIIAFMRKYQVDDTFVNDTFATLCMVTYYLHTVDSMNWQDNDNQNSDSSQGDVQKQRWEIKVPTLVDNEYAKTIPDQVWEMKELCDHFFKVRADWFKQYVKNMPIAISNFIKNKVMPYKEGIKNTNLRRIYKVKKIKKQAQKSDEQDNQE